MEQIEAADATEETILLARITIHLVSGESFELLPFLDAADVKSKVTDLIDDWVKSGYLIRGGKIYPWHQVKLISASPIEELSRSVSQQQLIQWKALDLIQLQQNFWKTKEARRKNGEGRHKSEPANHEKSGDKPSGDIQGH